MKKYINDGKVIAEGTAIDYNGVTYFNPTASRYASCGWEEYTPAEQSETDKKKAEIEGKIAEVKEELATYDYIGVKIAMGVATKEEYAHQIAYTQTLRDYINDLQSQLESI